MCCDTLHMRDVPFNPVFQYFELIFRLVRCRFYLQKIVNFIGEICDAGDKKVFAASVWQLAIQQRYNWIFQCSHVEASGEIERHDTQVLMFELMVAVTKPYAQIKKSRMETNAQKWKMKLNGQRELTPPSDFQFSCVFTIINSTHELATYKHINKRFFARHSSIHSAT